MSMQQKILVLLAFISAQFLIVWFGYFMGKLPSKGVFLGVSYNSTFVRMLITQVQFIYVPIITNFFYGMGFQWGNSSFKSFLVVITLWFAAGPVAAVLFNVFVTKERIDLPIVLGITLVALGSILVVAHKEVSQWLT